MGVRECLEWVCLNILTHLLTPTRTWSVWKYSECAGLSHLTSPSKAFLHTTGQLVWGNALSECWVCLNIFTHPLKVFLHTTGQWVWACLNISTHPLKALQHLYELGVDVNARCACLSHLTRPLKVFLQLDELGVGGNYMSMGVREFWVGVS
jgi:hypothetical protein